MTSKELWGDIKALRQERLLSEPGYDETECRDVIVLFSALKVSKEQLKQFYVDMLSNINEMFGFPVD